MFKFRFQVLRHFCNHILSLLRNEVLNLTGIANLSVVFTHIDYLIQKDSDYSPPMATHTTYTQPVELLKLQCYIHQ